MKLDKDKTLDLVPKKDNVAIFSLSLFFSVKTPDISRYKLKL